MRWPTRAKRQRLKTFPLRETSKTSMKVQNKLTANMLQIENNTKSKHEERKREDLLLFYNIVKD